MNSPTKLPYPPFLPSSLSSDQASVPLDLDLVASLERDCALFEESVKLQYAQLCSYLHQMGDGCVAGVQLHGKAIHEWTDEVDRLVEKQEKLKTVLEILSVDYPALKDKALEIRRLRADVEKLEQRIIKS